MGRIKAVELVAHGMACDNPSCEVIVRLRNETSQPEGIYIEITRVTEAGYAYTNADTLFFHTRECLAEAFGTGAYSKFTNVETRKAVRL